MKFRLASFLLLFCSILPASLSTYQITVNTSSLNGSEGYIDFQFNPANSLTDPATAQVRNFFTDGSLNPFDLANGAVGSVAGNLPGGLTLGNTGPFNDYFEAETFGSVVKFSIALSVTPSPGAASGSLFLFSLYGPDAVTPLLTSSPNGEVASIALSPDGSTTASGNPVAAVTATPEPSSWMMVGIPAVMFLARLRRRS